MLICGGGLAALIGVAVSATGALQEQAEAAVGDYLEAVADRRYDDAYNLLCDEAQRDESRTEFRDRVSSEEPIADYSFGDLNYVTLALPIEATYDNGGSVELEAYLGQDTDTGDFEVCSLGE